MDIFMYWFQIVMWVIEDSVLVLILFVVLQLVRMGMDLEYRLKVIQDWLVKIWKLGKID